MEFWDLSLSYRTFAIIAVGAAVILVLAFNLIVERQSNQLFSQWKSQDLAREQTRLAREARDNLETEFRSWKSTFAGRIRRDAIARSKMVIAGRVAESIVPFMPEFSFNPKDARFIGSPIDYIIFDGLDADDIQEVVFLEVKTSNSRLTKRQKQIRDAIIEGRVSWEEIRVGNDLASELIPDEEFDDIL